MSLTEDPLINQVSETSNRLNTLDLEPDAKVNPAFDSDGLTVIDGTAYHSECEPKPKPSFPAEPVVTPLTLKSAALACRRDFSTRR